MKIYEKLPKLTDKFNKLSKIMKLSPHTLCCLFFVATFFSCAAVPKVTESPPPATENHANVEDSSLVQETLPEGIPQQEAIPQALALGAVLDSVAVLESPAEQESPLQGLLPEVKESASMVLESSPAKVPPIKFKPVIPEYIMGRGIILPEDMSAFLLGANPSAGKEFVEDLAVIYLEEATIEGVNHDAAFAQMCLETGFLKFGGLVTPDMNNFCGLGAIGPGQTGARFPDPRTGVRAHIQHLKAYATEAPLKQDLVDPRYNLVRSGSSPAIKGLAGTWATDRSYADKIKNILERLYDFVY